MMLSLDTAYRSFGGEVEASSTPTICRLPDSRRHQLSAIARASQGGGTVCLSDRESTPTQISHKRTETHSPQVSLVSDRKLNLETLSFQKACDDPACDRKRDRGGSDWRL